MGKPTKKKALSRRRFLKASGWIAAGITVAVYGAYRAMPALPSFGDPETSDGVAWVQALADGRIRFFGPRMEMGQGATLGLSQVVAEELNIDQSDIDFILPDTDQTPPFQMTVGSQSIAHFFGPVSWGAAQLREALRRLAATKSKLPLDKIKDGRGGFILPDGSTLGYGALVSDAAVVVSGDELLPDDALHQYALKPAEKLRVIGQDWRHPDLEAIVTGKMTYARDVSIPDMAFGAVIYPPAFDARFIKADVAKAKAIPGIIGIEIDEGDGFVGIVADSPFILADATDALNVQWQIDEDFNQKQIDASFDVDKIRLDDDLAHTLLSSGDLDAGRQSAKHSLTSRYDTPFAAMRRLNRVLPWHGLKTIKLRFGAVRRIRFLFKNGWPK